MGETYAIDLRESRLQIGMHWKEQHIQVQPPPITLERIATWLRESGGFVPPYGPLTGELYFDPAGGGQVRIRHKDVPIVRNMRDIEPLWEGFATSVLCTGYLDGAFDVDFLTPLATRNQFEDNQAWRAFSDWLSAQVPLIADEVQDKLETIEIQQLVEVDAEARRLAGKALRTPMLRGLQLLGGTRSVRQKTTNNDKQGQGQTDGKEGKKKQEPRTLSSADTRGQGMAIRLVERPFSRSKRNLHSEYADDGRVIINTVHPHYKRFVDRGLPKTQVWYEALLIGKETVGYNYDGSADALERLLAFTCEVDGKLK